MKINDLLLEARRNSDINPKVDSLSRLNYLAKDPTLQVTFTDFPKVGVNPISVDYKTTPLGYYSYPLDYAVGNMNTFGRVRAAVPFAGDRKYAIVYRITGRILYIDRYRPTVRDSMAIRKYAEKLSSDELVKTEIEWMGENTMYDEGLMYYILKTSQMLSPRIGKKTIVIMRDILRDVLGWDAVSDSGKGLIHTNEPAQAVVFDRRNIKIVEIIDNSYKKVSPRSDTMLYSMGDREDNIIQSMSRLIEKFKRDVDLSELRTMEAYELALIAPTVSKFTREFSSLLQDLREFYIAYTGRLKTDNDLTNLSPRENTLIYTGVTIIAEARKRCYEVLHGTPDSYLVRDMYDWKIYMQAATSKKYGKV